MYENDTIRGFAKTLNPLTLSLRTMQLKKTLFAESLLKQQLTYRMASFKNAPVFLKEAPHCVCSSLLVIFLSDDAIAVIEN